jgi:hypothetical protein
MPKAEQYHMRDSKARDVEIRVRITVADDSDPDLSYLGTWSHTQKGEFSIEHNERGAMPYFNAENVENMEQAEQNYRRALDFGNGWYCVGIQAVASVTIPMGHDSAALQAITSPGLWGIESDSGKDYMREVAREELEQLRDMLLALGLPESKVGEAIEGCDCQEVE